MAYLVQRKFSNEYRDFNLSQAEFYVDYNYIEPVIDSYIVVEKIFEERNVKKLTKKCKEKGLVVKTNSHGTIFILAAYMKVWNLLDRQPVTSNPAVGYYWIDGQWVPARQGARQIKNFIASVN